jgi:hypothetical protein
VKDFKITFERKLLDRFIDFMVGFCVSQREHSRKCEIDKI